MAKRVEVGSEALLVDKFDACRFEIGAEAIHVRHEVSENSLLACGQLSNKQSNFVFHVGVQSNDGLLMILGRRSADIDKRLRRLKVNIIPLQLGQLAATKPCQSRSQIKCLPRPCNAYKTVHFIVRKCPAGTYLLAVGLDLLNMLQRIFRNTLVFSIQLKKVVTEPRYSLSVLGDLRLSIDRLNDPEVRENLRLAWIAPKALDPARRTAYVTPEIAEKLGRLAQSLVKSGHTAEAVDTVATVLICALFTMFAEDVEFLARDSFINLLKSLLGHIQKLRGSPAAGRIGLPLGE
jgi:hypothetical protein